MTPVSTNNSLQKLVERIDNRSASYHVQPDVILCFDRLCKPQASDIILDPMCGTGAIPLEVRQHVDEYQQDLWWPQLCKFKMSSHRNAFQVFKQLLELLISEYWQPSDFYRGNANIASFIFLLNRGPLNSVIPSTLLVTTMTWLLTAQSITSATSRSGGQIKAGEDGDIFLKLSFSVHFCNYWTFTGVQHLFQCVWIAYWHSALGSVQFTHKDQLHWHHNHRHALWEEVTAVMQHDPQWWGGFHYASMHLHPKLFFFVVLQDGLKEEELGPLPVLPERNGPRVQARLGEGGVVDAG